MRIVLVSSPGAGPAPHWSHACASALAGELVRAGAAVVWFASLRSGQLAPAPPTGVELRCPPPLPVRPLHRVADDSGDAALEVALASHLRAQPAVAVVHVGAGARGTPNVCWLAERMGSEPFAIVRAAEIVCHRGDLVDATGAACHDATRAERCRRCCAASWWRTPWSDELPNRSDLLAGSLAVAAAVFVGSADDVAPLQAFGANPRTLVVGAEVPAIAARVLARAR